MIQVAGLSKRFGHQLALHNIDLGVKAGEITALLGPNGAGKTTLLRILASLAKPSLGEIRVAGFRFPQEAVQARSQIGFLAHQPLIYEDLSAEQNLAFYARLYRINRSGERISELLQLFGLDIRRRDPVRTFSRGMQQRLALARCLLHQPKVLLLDEPHTGLDKDSAALIDRTLRGLANLGCAILVATHDLDRALRLAHRVEILGGGRLLASSATRKLSVQKLPALYRDAVRKAQKTANAH
jgi:heme exporter protein A